MPYLPELQFIFYSSVAVHVFPPDVFRHCQEDAFFRVAVVVGQLGLDHKELLVWFAAPLLNNIFAHSILQGKSRMQ